MPAPVGVRRKLRQAVYNALKGWTKLGVSVESPGDWSTPPEKLPAVQVRNDHERKTAITRTFPEFTTVVYVVIEARLKDTTDEGAQDAIEAFGAKIERAVLTNAALLSLIQQVESVETAIEITGEGKEHIAGLKITLGLETYESFDPTDLESDDPGALQPFQEMQIHLDTNQPFDPNGTYSNPPFPDAVSPAPRTSGPDGRDEGALDITLPQ